MSDYRLTAEPFLGGYSGRFDGTALTEVTDLALVSIAVPLERREALEAALRETYGLVLPAAGQTARSADGSLLLLGLGPDQVLVVLPHPGGVAADVVAAALGSAGYFTEQSDNWVMLRLEGKLAVAALERICPLDLDPAAFPEGRVARTVMEHLGTVILREGPARFLLLSASSSARSFLHALETSMGNVS